MNPSAQRFAPATERNREPILAVLRSVLPARGMVLEVSSGTGQHAVFFAPRLRPLRWQPSEPDAELRESIRAWQAAEPSDNLLPPLDLDVLRSPWPTESPIAATSSVLEQAALERSVDQEICAITNINMIHIAPWQACLALMAGAGRILPPNGVLYLYGPYKRGGRHTSPSNEAFDRSLRHRDSSWGVRDLEAVTDAASAQGLALQRIVEMPAHNLSLVFHKVVKNSTFNHR